MPAIDRVDTRCCNHELVAQEKLWHKDWQFGSPNAASNCSLAYHLQLRSEIQSPSPPAAVRPSEKRKGSWLGRGYDPHPNSKPSHIHAQFHTAIRLESLIPVQAWHHVASSANVVAPSSGTQTSYRSHPAIRRRSRGLAFAQRPLRSSRAARGWFFVSCKYKERSAFEEA